MDEHNIIFPCLRVSLSLFYKSFENGRPFVVIIRPTLLVGMQELPIVAKMARAYLQIFLLLLIIQNSVAQVKIENGMKTEVFLSPKFELEPGSVAEKYYYNIDFPRGHIALKSFNAEVVDEKGNSIPLHETYLHHWVLLRYYQTKGSDIPKQNGDMGFLQSDHVIIKNSGVCGNGLPQYFGLGSETRETKTYVPDPYGIEIGNYEDEGYEERWLLNVHAIDTRGAEDKLGCTECRCDMYNVTLSGYVGGLRCCHGGMRCSVKEGYEGVKRSLYLKYTVKYLDWDEFIVPVKIYILDVTDIWTKGDESKGLRARHHCLVEYNVESCPVDVANDDECTHKKSLTVSFPTGGDVIYGVGHQHSGGIGTTLYGEGGKEICSSNPTYGKGDEPGNEAGYIVGMSTCYPSPGSVKISAGEMLTLVSKYSSSQRHTGVMGLFYLLIADPLKSPNNIRYASTDAHKDMTVSNLGWAIALFGAALIAVVIFVFQSRSGRGEGYEAITA